LEQKKWLDGDTISALLEVDGATLNFLDWEWNSLALVFSKYSCSSF